MRHFQRFTARLISFSTCPVMYSREFAEGPLLCSNDSFAATVLGLPDVCGFRLTPFEGDSLPCGKTWNSLVYLGLPVGPRVFLPSEAHAPSRCFSWFYQGVLRSHPKLGLSPPPVSPRRLRHCCLGVTLGSAVLRFYLEDWFFLRRRFPSSFGRFRLDLSQGFPVIPNSSGLPAVVGCHPGVTFRQFVPSFAGGLC